MNKQRLPVTLDPGRLARAWDYADAKVAHYRDGHSPLSRSVSGDLGADKRPLIHAQGKVGEMAVCALFGLNDDAIDWSLRDGDEGRDLVLPNGWRVDVKTNFEPTMYPSVHINKLYPEDGAAWMRAKFDVMISVSIDDDQEFMSRRGPLTVFIEGWMGKAEFWKRKRISQGRRELGEPPLKGTRFIDKADLHAISWLDQLQRYPTWEWAWRMGINGTPEEDLRATIEGLPEVAGFVSVRRSRDESSNRPGGGAGIHPTVVHGRTGDERSSDHEDH
jgi:hypothetical protein